MRAQIASLSEAAREGRDALWQTRIIFRGTEMAARVTGSGPKLSLIAGGYEETDTITVYFASQTVTELKRGEAIRWEGRVYQVVTTIAPTASMPEWRITATAL